MTASGEELTEQCGDGWHWIESDGWWRTAHTAVSWAHSLKTGQKAVKLPYTLVEESKGDGSDITLNTSLPGVVGALAALTKYETDVGFYQVADESSSLPSPSPQESQLGSREKWDDIMDSMFGGMLSCPSSSSSSSFSTLSHRATPSPTPSMSSMSISTTSTTPPPTTPGHSQLDATAHSFIPQSSSSLLKLHKDDQGFYSAEEISFEPFQDEDDDPFTVKAARRIVADDDGWISMDKVQRKKDLFEALTKRNRSTPQPDQDGWIDVSSSLPKDPKPPRQTSRRHRRKAPATRAPIPPPLPPLAFNPYAKPFLMPAVPYMFPPHHMPFLPYGVRMW